MRDVDTVMYFATHGYVEHIRPSRGDLRRESAGSRNVANPGEKIGIKTIRFTSSYNNYGCVLRENVDERTEP